MSRLQVFILAELNVAQAFKKVRGITVKELADRIPIKSPVDTVYRNIKILIDEGFVEKGIKGIKVGKSDSYYITEAGIVALKKEKN